MHTRDLRLAFRRFAGKDRFRKFVRAVTGGCRRKGRLLFWQQDLWRDFSRTVPDAPRADTDVISAFCVCDVHDCELEAPPLNEPEPEIRNTPEYEQARDSCFPFASNGNLICHYCWVEREKWVHENEEICKILRRKTTYEDYCTRLLDGFLDQPPEICERMRLRAAEIADDMEPGDELWEWDAGGWHRLAGSAGLAIVRNGKIVSQWCERRS